MSHSRLYNRLRNIGPGALVTAAFIGPGTVTVCTIAGVSFGMALLWAMVFSTVATVFLQEMAARIGIITQNGLSELIRRHIASSSIRAVILMLIFIAIVIGNAAYEAGNLNGAILGLGAISKSTPRWVLILLSALLAFAMNWFGSYRLLERGLLVMVIFMSLSFIITAILTKPSVPDILKGAFTPHIPPDSLFIVIGLIGTTVVPYNLFLHASVASKKWKSEANLQDSRWDTVISISLGGLVSMAIIISGAAIRQTHISNALDLAQAIEPLYGQLARYFLGAGLFAAGLTSAITAPLAAAIVANGCFGWSAGMKDYRFRIVWISVLALGLFSLGLGYKPIEIIKFAQVANGLLLPIIVSAMLWIVNKKVLMGKHTNNLGQNLIAVLLVTLTIALGIRAIINAF